jgi:Tfp pilus assembly protein PilW
MENFLQKNRKRKGFTLVEVLIASFLFLLIVSTIIGLLISIIEAQSLVLKDQRAISESSYAMEYMSRALRMAKKDTDGNCSGANNIYNLNSGEIRFLNYDNKCQAFGLHVVDGKQRIYEKKSANKVYNPNAFRVDVTSGNMFIESLVFNQAGSDWAGINNRPKVMISMRFGPNNEVLMRLQTLVSQRY